MTILVCGSRHWMDEEMIRRCLEPYRDEAVTLVEGDCSGADRMARRIGQEFGWGSRSFPAEWAKHGRRAGPIRNSRMLEEKPDVMFAFSCYLTEGSGTLDMLTKARRAGVLCYLNGEVCGEW